MEACSVLSRSERCCRPRHHMRPNTVALYYTFSRSLTLSQTQPSTSTADWMDGGAPHINTHRGTSAHSRSRWTFVLTSSWKEPDLSWEQSRTFTNWLAGTGKNNGFCDSPELRYHFVTATTWRRSLCRTSNCPLGTNKVFLNLILK